MPGMKKLDPMNVRIGLRLKELRELHSLNQSEMAKRLKLTRTNICNMESGRQNFMVYHFIGYSAALKIPVGKLFAWVVR